jgi:hypothetical protein
LWDELCRSHVASYPLNLVDCRSAILSRHRETLVSGRENLAPTAGTGASCLKFAEYKDKSPETWLIEKAEGQERADPHTVSWRYNLHTKHKRAHCNTEVREVNHTQTILSGKLLDFLITITLKEQLFSAIFECDRVIISYSIKSCNGSLGVMVINLAYERREPSILRLLIVHINQ